MYAWFVGDLDNSMGITNLCVQVEKFENVESQSELCERSHETLEKNCVKGPFLLEAFNLWINQIFKLKKELYCKR